MPIGIVAAVGALKFGFGIFLLFGYFLKHRRPPGLLIRPETSETKAKTETRECETETETETKKLLTETKIYETETSLVNSVAYESKRNRYAFIVDYIFEIINDE